MSSDIGRVSTGQAPASQPVPVAPVQLPGQVPVAPRVPVIAVPEVKAGSGMIRKLMYGVLALVVIGILFWVVRLFTSGSTSPTPSATPSLSVAPTLAPSGRSLVSYFTHVGPSINLKDTTTAKADFLNTLNTSQPNSQQALRLPVTGAGTLTLADFLNATAGAPLPGIQNALSSDWIALSYGQKEQFDASGQPVTNTNMRVRLVLIGELQDVSAANQAMTQAELSLPDTWKELIGIDPKNTTAQGFSPGSYRQIGIRYWNFPYADTSLDWAIVTASNNKNYLVISGSRESMFFTIDQLMQ